MFSRYVLFIYAADSRNLFLNENARDHCNEPYVNLKNSFASLGYQLEWTVNRPIEDYDWIFFLDASSAEYATAPRKFLRKIKRFACNSPIYSIFEEAVKGKLQDKLVLIMSEPPSVCPGNYDCRFHRHFRHIFTWKSSLADGNKYHRFYSPKTRIFPEVEERPFSGKKLLVNISSNKSSRHEYELYSERIKTIRFFEANYPDDFDHYGMGWNEKSGENHFPSYRGTVKHKWDLLPGYRFTICYENIRGEVDYISEKPFDAIRCKSVPIYWGAPNLADYVDPKAFINREDFASNEELARYLTGMKEPEYQRFIEAGKSYLASDKFRLFLSDNYVQTIFSALGLPQ